MTHNDLTLAAVLDLMIFLAVACAAQTVTDVVSFMGNNSLGAPSGTVTQGRNGLLYGTSIDPQGTCGSVFSLTAAGAATNLYTFTGTPGCNPSAGLTLSTDGNFYGTTGAGGTFNYGVLFRVSPSGAYAVLHNFNGADGGGPTAAPIQASDGNLYGTTSGGNFSATVYKYTHSGTFTTLYTFNNETYGDRVIAGLVQGSDGNLYGTAVFGGINDNGTVFKLTTSGTLLGYYPFPGGSGGSFPYGTLIQASDGYFYGTTYKGGYPLDQGYGTVFRMDRNLSVSILYSFDPYTDGVYPGAGLVQGTDGNLYGAQLEGGTNNLGALFQITTGGSYTQLYNFSSSIGQYPACVLLQNTSGLFYGTSQFGGAFGFGSVYSLSMGLGPFITFVSATGKVGQSAEILGQKLKGTTSVTFNGVPATSFSVKSGTFMTAVIPTGATTGPVVVTTPNGVLTSNKNFVIRK